MTLSKQLRELAGKATQGGWLLQATQTEGRDRGVFIVGDNLGGLVGAALPWPTEIESGDYTRVEANASLITSLVNNIPTILTALELKERMDKVLPIRVHDGPDYAEVFFGDGKVHSSQAMTMNPHDWREISAAIAALRGEASYDHTA